MPQRFAFDEVACSPATSDNVAIVSRKLEAGSCIVYNNQLLQLRHTILEGHRFAIQPMISLIQTTVATAAAERYQIDMDLCLADDASVWGDQLLALVLDVAEGAYVPKLFAQDNTDCQITRGLLGVSLQGQGYLTGEVYEMLKLLLLVILNGAVSLPALAGSVDIRHVTLSKQADIWKVSVTLQHADTGWQHYADAWRIVTETGKVLATRVLYHPHVNEQPFTRSLVNVKLPDDVQQVQVEARCNVHGWGKAPLRVDLNISKTPRYDINRED